MTESIPILVLVSFGLFFLYTGVISFQRPGPFAKSLSLEAVGVSGEVEIRAQYGGFFFAAALSQFAPLIGLLSEVSALIVSSTIFGGLFFGRLAAALAGPKIHTLSSTLRALFVIDAVGFIAASGAIALIVLQPEPTI
ncbi:MAG: hypothetical protein ACX94A_06010 [Algiphilus sp.]